MKLNSWDFLTKFPLEEAAWQELTEVKTSEVLLKTWQAKEYHPYATILHKLAYKKIYFIVLHGCMSSITKRFHFRTLCDNLNTPALISWTCGWLRRERCGYKRCYTWVFLKSPEPCSYRNRDIVLARWAPVRYSTSQHCLLTENMGCTWIFEYTNTHLLTWHALLEIDQHLLL